LETIKESAGMMIIENVYVVPEVVASPYILVDADGLTIIDTGFPRSEKKILVYIAGLGRSARDVKRILLTHSDLDHVGALSALYKATGARTFASRIEAEAIAAGKSSRPIKPRGFPLRRLLRAIIKPAPFQVDEILSDGQVLPVQGGLRVVATTGHSPGHLSFFAPAAGILFCGDSMVSDENGLHGSKPQYTWDATLAGQAVHKQAALGARIVCPSHGPVVREPGFSSLI
jgi:glyoxylase-like metal-dependent hydrolase (beta-lactamase superfamily II)